jgi:hypothetical protein
MKVWNATLIAALIVPAWFTACYVGPLESDEPSSVGTGGAGGVAAVDGGAAPSASGATGAPTGLPCDVAEVLTRNKCLDCHGAALSAPMPLLSHADMLAPGKSNPAKKNAELAVARMTSATSPMPPAPSAKASAADVQIIEKWIQAGYPKGACGEGDASAPVTTPSSTTVCTSGDTWSSGREEAPEMNPGKACVSCHRIDNARRGRERAPAGVGGTVYPTLHEPDLCFGVNGNATVVITDARNQVYTLPVNSTGNFYLYGAPAYPIRAKVIANGRTRAMNSAQMTGDCNSCHTVSGLNGAPGRIMLP